MQNKPNRWAVEFGFENGDTKVEFETHSIEARDLDEAQLKAEVILLRSDHSFVDDVIKDHAADWESYGDDRSFCRTESQPGVDGHYYISVAEILQPSHIKGFPRKHIVHHPYKGDGKLVTNLFDGARTDGDCNMFCVAEGIDSEDVNEEWYAYLSRLSPERRGPYWNVMLSCRAMESDAWEIKPSKTKVEWVDRSWNDLRGTNEPT